MNGPVKVSPRDDSKRANARVAIVGYGEGAGREHARRLRERGHDVQVAMLPGGRSWVQAVKDGFRPTRAGRAAAEADVVVILVPEDEAPVVYWEEIAPRARPGAMVIFGDELELDQERLPAGVDVAVVAMKDDLCLVSIQADATGHAHERAYAYIQWLGAHVPRPTSSRIRVADDADPFPHPSRRVL
jgi:ketol-acid reductoisomerase